MTTVKSNSTEGNQPDKGKSPLSSSSSSSSSSDSDDGTDSSSESDSSSASNSKTSSKQSNGQTAEKPTQFSVTSSDGHLRMKIAIPRSQSNSTPTPSPTSAGSSGIASGQHQQQLSPRDGKQKTVEHGASGASSQLHPATCLPSAGSDGSGVGKSTEPYKAGHEKRDKSATVGAEARSGSGRQHAQSGLSDKPSGRMNKPDGGRKGSDGRTNQAGPKGSKRTAVAGVPGKRKKSVSESDSSSPSSSYSSCSSNSDSETSSSAAENGSGLPGGKKTTGGSGDPTRTTAKAGSAAGKKQKLLKRKKANRSGTTSSSEDEREDAPVAGGNRGGQVHATNQSSDCDSSSSDDEGKRFSHARTSKAKQMGQAKVSRSDMEDLPSVGPPLSTSTPAKQPYASMGMSLMTATVPPPTVDGGLTAEGGSCSSDNELPALVSAAIRRVESGSDAESIRGTNAGPTQQYTSSLLREFVVKTQMLGSVEGGGSGGGTAGGSVPVGAGTGGLSKATATQRSPSSSSSSSSSSGGSSSSSSSSSVDEGGPDPAIGSAGPGPGGGVDLDVRKIKTESPVPAAIGGRSTPLVNGVTSAGGQHQLPPAPAAPRRRGRPPKSSLANAAAVKATTTGINSKPVAIPIVSESPDSGILSTHSSSTGSPKQKEKQKGATAATIASRRSKSEASRGNELPSSASIARSSPVPTAATTSSTSRGASTSYAINSCLDRNTYATERVLYPPRSAKKRGVGRPPKKDTQQQQQQARGHTNGPLSKIDISKKFHEPRLSGYKSDGGHSTICCSKRLASQSGYISDYGGVGASGGGRSRLSGYKSDYSARSRRSCGRSGGGGYRSDYGRARSCGYRSDCSTRHRKQVRRKRRKKIPTEQHQQPEQAHHNNNVDDRKNYNSASGAAGGGSNSGSKSASVGELEIMFMAGLTLGSTSDEDDSSSTSSSTSSSSAGSRESLFSAASTTAVPPPPSATPGVPLGKGARKRLPTPPPPQAVKHKEVKALVQRLPKTPRKPAASRKPSPVKPPGARARAKSVSAVDRRRHTLADLDDDDVEDRWLGGGGGSRVRNKTQQATVAPTPKPSIAATASVALKQKSSAMVRKPGQRGRPPGSVKKPPPAPPTPPADPVPSTLLPKSSAGRLDVLLAPGGGGGDGRSGVARLPVNNFGGVFASMCGKKSDQAIFAFSSSTVEAKNSFAAYLLRDAASRSKEQPEGSGAGGNNLVVPPVKKGLPLSKANVIKNSEECNKRFQRSSSSFALSVVGGGRSVGASRRRYDPEGVTYEVGVLEAKPPEELHQRPVGGDVGQELRRVREDSPAAPEHDESVQ
ncbi:AGAP001535-PA-like protein [Anopheles sinensis]|uniref:AGAP001535-PA-like protein n=1 Tax=Anopheles sinensis TaxID=74873 RepID=A0A084VC76_ANOSI|nr:AGAP001535-PA-like protein [Anopheles sinensis]